jgi:hypothetical protein
VGSTERSPGFRFWRNHVNTHVCARVCWPRGVWASTKPPPPRIMRRASPSAHFLPDRFPPPRGTRLEVHVTRARWRNLIVPFSKSGWYRARVVGDWYYNLPPWFVHEDEYVAVDLEFEDPVERGSQCRVGFGEYDFTPSDRRIQIRVDVARTAAMAPARRLRRAVALVLVLRRWHAAAIRRQLDALASLVARPPFAAFWRHCPDDVAHLIARFAVGG